MGRLEARHLLDHYGALYRRTTFVQRGCIERRTGRHEDLGLGLGSRCHDQGAA